MGRELERRIATQRLLESPVWEHMALKILLLETAFNVLSAAVEEKDKQIARCEAKLVEAYEHIGVMASRPPVPPKELVNASGEGN